jgi:hypothetical protein
MRGWGCSKKRSAFEEGQYSKGKISKVLRCEKKPQGFEFRKNVMMVNKP